jgi:hypothetical protein
MAEAHGLLRQRMQHPVYGVHKELKPLKRVNPFDLKAETLDLYGLVL